LEPDDLLEQGRARIKLAPVPDQAGDAPADGRTGLTARQLDCTLGVNR